MPDKGEAIIDAARVLFLEQGYDATSLDEIAARANVSKTTVYARFNDKETLFATVVRCITARADQVLATLEAALTTETDLETRLRDLARALLTGILRPEVIQLRRLAVAEALRFPEVAGEFWHTGPEQTAVLLTKAFDDLTASEQLQVDVPLVAARHFIYLTVGHYQDRALLDAADPPSDGELTAHVEAVVSAFLAAHGNRTGTNAGAVGSAIPHDPKSRTT